MSVAESVAGRANQTELWGNAVAFPRSLPTRLKRWANRWKRSASALQRFSPGPQARSWAWEACPNWLAILLNLCLDPADPKAWKVVLIAVVPRPERTDYDSLQLETMVTHHDITEPGSHVAPTSSESGCDRRPHSAIHADLALTHDIAIVQARGGQCGSLASLRFDVQGFSGLPFSDGSRLSWLNSASGEPPLTNRYRGSPWFPHPVSPILLVVYTFPRSLMPSSAVLPLNPLC